MPAWHSPPIRHACKQPSSGMAEATPCQVYSYEYSYKRQEFTKCSWLNSGHYEYAIALYKYCYSDLYNLRYITLQ